LVAATIVGRWLPLHDVTRLDPRPSMHWPEPEVDDILDPDDGPILVTIDYAVRPGEEDAFVEAMGSVARSRRRTGARRWELYRDPAAPDHFFETFLIATWAEHRRQHFGRLTVFDRQAEERAHSFLAEPTVVRHLVSADVPLDLSKRAAGDDRG
jgi:quinol monooxygenase YgiN